MKYSLAISGGAARGAFSLGCLQYFDDHNIEVEVISGTSIGAVIASSYACGIKPRKLLDIFLSKDFKKAIKFNFLNNSFIKIDEEAKILKKIVPIENIEDFPKKVIITAVDLKSGELIYFTKGNALKVLLGSCAIAPIFRPIEYEDYLLVDGGVKEHLPIEILKKENLPIIAINHFPTKKYTKSSAKESLKRMIYLSWYSTFERSIEDADEYITSEKLHDIRLFSFKDLKKAFLLGYKQSSKVFSKTL